MFQPLAVIKYGIKIRFKKKKRTGHADFNLPRNKEGLELSCSCYIPEPYMTFWHIGAN